MKKFIILSLLLVTGITSAKAQVTVPEPDFLNSFFILKSDDSSAQLPKEMGVLAAHENKTKGILGKVGKIANVAGVAGALGTIAGVNAGSVGAIMTGIRVTSTASAAGDMAEAVSVLANSEGMDIVFNGGSSVYGTKPDGEGMRILTKVEDNNYDPMDRYRVVKFSANKKQRKVQWVEISSSMLGDSEAKKGGFLPFTAEKYGESSYLLTIPADVLEPGEYAIFCMEMATSASIPAATFSIPKK